MNDRISHCQAHLDIAVEVLIGMLSDGEHKYRIKNGVPSYADVDDVTFNPHLGTIRLHFNACIPGDPIVSTLP